jgi:hypothetical protein
MLVMVDWRLQAPLPLLSCAVRFPLVALGSAARLEAPPGGTPVPAMWRGLLPA